MSEGESMIHIVKKKIYLAGRISKNDWRPCHGVLHDADGLEAISRDGFAIYPVEHGGYQFEFTGPFFVADDHGCGHGPNTHGVGIGSTCIDSGRLKREQRQFRVAAACYGAIRRSDVLFAWLEPDAYGTAAEIGMARALGKHIYVGGPSSKKKDDLWFPAALANAVLDATFPAEALTELLEYLWRQQEAVNVCESPVERLLFQSFNRHRPFVMQNAMAVSNYGAFKIYSQYHTGNYRLDFAIVSEGKKVAVEVDGHDFHERTKEQAQRDKKRDRDLQADGWAVLRFTGSEVYQNADKCAAEAIAMVAGPTR